MSLTAASAIAALRRVPAWVWALIAVCVVLLALRWHWIGVGEDRVQAAWDKAEAGHRAAAADHAAEVRTIEARWRADFDAAVSRLTKENTDALVERDGLIADLRAGNVRLRDKFRCPDRRVPDVAGPPGGSDGSEGGYLSIEDQTLLVRLGAEADAITRQLTACQAIIGGLK